MKVTASRCQTPNHDGNPNHSIYFIKTYKKNKEKMEMIELGFKWWMTSFVNIQRLFAILCLLLNWLIGLMLPPHVANAEDIDVDGDAYGVEYDDEDIDDECNVIYKCLYYSNHRKWFILWYTIIINYIKNCQMFIHVLSDIYPCFIRCRFY